MDYPITVGDRYEASDAPDVVVSCLHESFHFILTINSTW